MQNRSILLTSLLLLQLLSTYAQEVRIAAAASMVDFLEEAKIAFEQQSDQEIQIISNSSGALANQIRNGAPFDLYLSANSSYTTQLFELGIGTQAPVVFAHNQLVFWSKKEVSSIEEFLKSDDYQSLGIAQPELAPFGALAKKFLEERLEVYDQVGPKLIYGNNISIVNQYIYSGAVDAAFTSASSQLKLTKTTPCCWQAMPKVQPLLISQSALLLTLEGMDFYDFLIHNPATIQLLDKYGYVIIH